MSFKDIKGQQKAVLLIKEYINRPDRGGSFLFSGPEGVGKKLFALQFAKALNCEDNSSDACDQCPSCLKINQRQHPDIHFIDDPESGSIKIEDIRVLQRAASLRPYEARKKVFIIDNAHNLTPEAASALLKTLEEPPKDSVIILISSKTALLFKTLISRCQAIKFCPLERAVLEQVLKNDYGLEHGAAHFLSFYSEGRIGVALKLKGTDIFRQKNDIIDQFILRKNNGAFLISQKNDLRTLLNILAVWFRDVYLAKSGSQADGLINLDRENDVLKSAREYSLKQLNEAVDCISDSLLRLEQNINTKLILSNLKNTIKN